MILEDIPSLMLYLVVGGGLSVVAFSVWRHIAPAAEGLILGYYEILGRYGGGKLVKRFKGTLVDCTNYFMNPAIEPKLKEYLKGEMKRRAERGKHQELEKKIDETKIDGLCRVVATRDYWRKHIFIQLKNIALPLNSYAGHEEERKFTFGMGFLSKGVVTGKMDSCSLPWNIPKHSKAMVHFLIPDASPSAKDQEVHIKQEELASLVLFAPANVEIDAKLKALNAIIKDQEKQIRDGEHEKSAMRTEVDTSRRIMANFSAENGEPPKPLKPMHFDIPDLLAIILPATFSYFVAEQMQVHPLIGVIIGMVAGSLIAYARRR